MAKISPGKKAKQLLKHFKNIEIDYLYMKKVFQALRRELDIEVPKGRNYKKLPYVPNEEELQKYYKEVWDSKNLQDMIIIKILLYTGVRVSELINIKIVDIDFVSCQIRINQGKGNKDRIVPFPASFKELLAMHTEKVKEKCGKYLFESSWKKQYTDRGIRKILQKYSKLANMPISISPHKMRHFLFTWLKKQGIDDALIQPFSGHESRKSLEIYSRLSIKDAQNIYDQVIPKFPI